MPRRSGRGIAIRNEETNDWTLWVLALIGAAQTFLACISIHLYHDREDSCCRQAFTRREISIFIVHIRMHSSSISACFETASDEQFENRRA